jgi:hypothetical protein
VKKARVSGQRIGRCRRLAPDVVAGKVVRHRFRVESVARSLVDFHLKRLPLVYT